jgi:outer membrane protein insertion porin family
MRPVLPALLLFLLSVFAPALAAQFADDGPAPVVNEIQIDFGELKNVSREVVMAHMQLRKGGPFDQLLLDRSVRSLYDTGLFDFVQAEVNDLSPNLVNITLHLQSKYRIQEVTITGNKAYSRRKLLGKMELETGGVLDERLVATGADAVRDFYRTKGYSNVKVDYRINRNPATGLGVVVIEVNEGKRLKISKINFDGNEAFSDGDLRDQMETSRYKWWWSWASGSGRIDEEKLDEDMEKIRKYYVNHGYLDFELTDDDLQFIESGDTGVILNFKIEEGRQYYVGDISVSGVSLFQEVVVTLSLQMIPGDPFSPEKLEEDLETITDLYGAVGRLEAHVRAERIPTCRPATSTSATSSTKATSSTSSRSTSRATPRRRAWSSCANWRSSPGSSSTPCA